MAGGRRPLAARCAGEPFHSCEHRPAAALADPRPREPTHGRAGRRDNTFARMPSERGVTRTGALPVLGRVDFGCPIALGSAAQGVRGCTKIAKIDMCKNVRRIHLGTAAAVAAAALWLASWPRSRPPADMPAGPVGLTGLATRQSACVPVRTGMAMDCRGPPLWAARIFLS